MLSEGVGVPTFWAGSAKTEMPDWACLEGCHSAILRQRRVILGKAETACFGGFTGTKLTAFGSTGDSAQAPDRRSGGSLETLLAPASGLPPGGT